MTDTIIVSGGGSVVVASDAILARLDALGALADRCRARGFQVGQVAQAMTFAAINAPQGAAVIGSSREALEAAEAALMRAAEHAASLAAITRQCLAVYSEVDRFAEGVVRRVSAADSWLLGRLAFFAAIPAALSFVADDLIYTAVTGQSPSEQVAAVSNYLVEHPKPITNPTVVALLRESVENTGEFGAGFAGLPPGALQAMEAAAHEHGLPVGAAMVMMLAHQAGLLTETPVRTRPTSTSTVEAPPASLEDRLRRIPEAADEPNGEQIRIDRYSSPGHPDRFDVYIGGTVDFGLRADKDPFDMTSNIAGVAHESPASLRAVESAMRQSGITAESPIVVSGYSQGGLIAAMVAGGGYNVKGLVTFGGPVGEIPVPANVPTLTVRNAEDIVPATGGYDSNPHAVVVTRTAFPDGDIPNAQPVPAHERDAYLETARQVDLAQSNEVRSLVRGFDTFGADSTVTSTLWKATRVTSSAGG